MTDQNQEPKHFRKLFIGGLSSNTTEESLTSYFSQYGEIIDTVILRNPENQRSKGYGFLTFTNSAMVDACQKARPHNVDGKAVDTKRVTPPQQQGMPPGQRNSQSVKKLFVGGIRDASLTEDEIKAYFSTYGNVQKVNIVMDKETGRSKGFAFVEFDDHDCVDKAVLRTDHAINGQKCDVKKALVKPPGGMPQPGPGWMRGGMVGSHQYYANYGGGGPIYDGYYGNSNGMGPYGGYGSAFGGGPRGGWTN